MNNTPPLSQIPSDCGNYVDEPKICPAMSDKIIALKIIKDCACMDAVTELKMIHIAFTYWEEGLSPEDSVGMAASFILNNDKDL